MTGRPPKRKSLPPSASLLDMMESGEGFRSVPLEDIPEPPSGSFGELYRILEEHSAEFQRLGALEPDLIRARNMLNSRVIVRERAEECQRLLGCCMIRFFALAEDREIINLAHLVRDTCAAMKPSGNRSYIEGLIGPVAFANFEKYSKGLISDDGLRKAGRKALAAVGMTWHQLRTKLSSDE